MIRLTGRQIAHIVGGRLTHGDPGATYRIVVTDSRSLSNDRATTDAGVLFVALVGERFDGHDFVAEAHRNGARGVIASRPLADPEGFGGGRAPAWIQVDDTQRALEALGSAVRSLHPGRFVAITGSVGKTTMKDMVAAALEADAPGGVAKTPGNLNNHIGVPLALTATSGAERFVVLELGMSAPGEICRLTHLARPDVGIVTRAAAAHLEFFDSVDAIADAKAELWEHLPAGGKKVVNADDARLLARVGRGAAEARVVTYGLAPTAELRLVGTRPCERGIALTVASPDGELHFDLATVGQHSAHNAAGALAVVHALGLPLQQAAAALSAGFRTGHHRLSRVDIGRLHVLDDCYNANPASMRAALEAFEGLARGSERRVAVLGTMHELGPEAALLHRELGREAAERGVTQLFATGPQASALADGARAAGLLHVVTADEVTALFERIAGATEGGGWLLLKGSRAERLERVLAALGSGRATGHGEAG